MIKNIIKEVYESDLSGFFDCDCYSKAAGDFGYTVFCVTSHYGNYSSGINEKDFEDITKELDYIINDISEVLDGNKYYYKSIKEIMSDYKIPYTPKRAHELKNLVYMTDYVEQITAFLSIKTGDIWKSKAARGYCQGDYADIIYNTKYYEDRTASIIGDMFLGCGREYSITELDNDGNELDTIYGYYVSDTEATNYEDIKTVVCSYEGLDPEKTQLQVVENVSCVYVPTYRTV